MIDWNEDRIEKLRTGVADGLSYSQIAKRIGHGCTRGAAIGKANRMGYAQPPAASKPVLRAPTVARAPHQNAGLAFRTRKFGIAGHGAAPRITARNMVFVEPEPRPARAAAPAPEAIGPTARPLAELGRQMCRWGLTDPGRGRMDETLFCGAHVEDGAYCSHHTRVAHQPLAPGRPRTGNQLVKSLRRYV